MAILTSFNENTYKNLQLDAGIFVANLDVAKFLANGVLSDSKNHILLGATKGGASFSAVPEVRSIFDGIDGARGNYKNGQVMDTWEITMKTSVAEMTASNFGHVIANVKQEKIPKPLEPLVTAYHKLNGQVGMVGEKLYLDNLCWLGSVAGSEKPLLIELKNVLNTNGVNLTSEDKGTGAIECEFKAHFKLGLNEVPYAIYTPIDLEPLPYIKKK